MSIEATNTNATTDASTFIGRVLTHDSTKKGVAAIVAGLLVAAVSETIWPSKG